MTNMERRTRKNLFPWIGTIAGILVISVIAVFFISFKLYERNRQLGFVPSALKVSKIIYSEEATSYYSEGAGVIIYELPEEIAAGIQKDGLGFFSNIDAYYGEWAETPLLPNLKWRREMTGDSFICCTTEPQLKNYLANHHFRVFVEPDIESQINGIIVAPSAYFAGADRERTIIVAPDLRRVFIVYSFDD